MTSPIPCGGSFFEDLKALPSNYFGLGASMTVKVPTESIRKAATYIDLIGLDLLIEGWMAEDREASGKGPGGREPIFSVRSILIAQQAIAIAYGYGSLKSMYELLTANLTRETRALLGLPVDYGYADKALNRKRKDASYHSVTRRFAAITRTFDPKPFPTWRSLTAEEAKAIDDARDPVDVEMRQKRADHLQHLLLTAVLKELPAEYLDAWSGDITLDGTKVPIWGQKGHGRHNLGARRRGSDIPTLSPEVNAGWHAKERDSRDDALAGRGSKVDYTHAMELHVALMSNREGRDLPPLIVGISLDRPGRSPGQNASHCVKGLREAGFKAGTMTVDMGYSLKAPENYALPMVALGFDLMHMFQDGQLGVRLESYGGLSVIEGAVYGPCLPDTLRTATLDHVAGRIDDDTFVQRIEARRAYEARIKTAPNGAASYVWRCPGAGKGRTVRCDYKPVPASQRADEVAANRHLPLIIDLPSKADSPICANSATISVPAEKFAQWRTKYPYMTPEWKQLYGPVRNEMEGKNGFLKRSRIQLADEDQRRFRGWGKQYLAVLTKLVAANVRTLCAFIWSEMNAPAPTPIIRPGRKAKPGIVNPFADPNAPPLRIVGYTPTKKGKSVA